jgi:hypothetical membrane protein
LWSGPAAAVLFFAGTLLIGALTPDYSSIRQTVSELGQVGAPGQFAFTILLGVVAILLLIAAFAMARTLRARGHSIAPAILVGAMAVSCAGVGYFSFPLPLHNVFGMSETIGLQAPLAAALIRARDPAMRRAKKFSAILYVLVLIAIAINLVPLIRPPGAWELVRRVFGLVQRSLFAAWFVWCAGYCLLLRRASSWGALRS